MEKIILYGLLGYLIYLFITAKEEKGQEAVTTVTKRKEAVPVEYEERNISFPQLSRGALTGEKTFFETAKKIEKIKKQIKPKKHDETWFEREVRLNEQIATNKYKPIDPNINYYKG